MSKDTRHSSKKHSFKRLELSYLAQGKELIVGVDEAGRGCLAGPLSVGMVVFNDALRKIRGLNDSKLLSHTTRALLYTKIIRTCTWEHEFMTAQEVDELGLTLAQTTAVNRMLGRLQNQPDFILIDGKQKWHFECESKSIIKGDRLAKSIAAASIIAKVSRDLFMYQQHQKYPKYGFDTHVGYGTAQHLAALRTHGVLDLHRKSYAPIQTIIQTTTTESIADPH